jgi:hypothetical protein
MLDTTELLARLEAKGVRNVDMAKVLGLPDSRIPEIRDRRRALKLDEAAKLVRAFELEPDSPAVALPKGILRLTVQHVASRLGVDLEKNRAVLNDVTQDLRAFSEYVADPKVRRSIDAAEGFFRAMALRRPATATEGQSENDPERTH